MRLGVWSPGHSSIQCRHVHKSNSLACSSGTPVHFCVVVTIFVFILTFKDLNCILYFNALHCLLALYRSSIQMRSKSPCNQQTSLPSEHTMYACLAFPQCLCQYFVCGRACLQSGITIEWRKPTTFGDAGIAYYQLMVCPDVLFVDSNRIALWMGLTFC